MENNYRLSIIIPHYNTPDLLLKLLETIPDRKEIQTIVVDDHSSENVKQQLKKLELMCEKRQISFYENDTEEHNAGATRNIGLQHAKGDWLLFADADDYFMGDFYDEVKKFFDSNYDIIFFPPTSIKIDTGEPDIINHVFCNYLKSYWENPNKWTELNLRYHWRVPWSKMIKRSLVQENNISFDSSPLYNDAMFSCKTGNLANSIATSEVVIYCATRHKGSLTTKLDLDSFDIQTNERIKEIVFLKSHLTKKEFRIIEEYKIPWQRLMIIHRRRYGIRVFFKYLRLFQKNKVLIFDVRMFAQIRPQNWLKGRRYEYEIREHYQG